MELLLKPGGSSMTDNVGDEDRTVLERLLWVVEALREVKPNIRAHEIGAYLRVALSEGKSVAELTKDAGVAQSVMSRALLDIGPRDRSGEAGAGLVEHRLSPVNMREHQVVLTRKGVSLARKIAGMLSKRR